MIRNIIFDMGNVLLTFEPDLIIHRYVTEPNDYPLIRKELFQSSEWQLLDKGTITYEQARKQVCDRLPERLHQTVTDIFEHWDDVLPTLEESCDLAQELKNLGYHIYLLSNASLRFYQYEHTIPAFQYFDGKIISADIKFIKPEPEIYQALFHTFQLKPEECFFIDDLSANVEAGRQAGMTCYQYDGNMESLRRALVQSGVPVSTQNVLDFVPVKTDKEIQEMADLAHEIWNQHFVPLIGQKQVDYMLSKFQCYSAMKEQIEHQGYQYYFFHYNGRNIGYIGLKPEEKSLFLSKLYLKQCYRGRHLATRAFEFMESFCIQRGLNSIYLTVNKHNDNTIAVYKKCGFKIIRAQISDIGNGFVMDDYIMEKTF